MAEIKLSDGTLIKSPKTVSELNATRIAERSSFVRVEDRDGKEWYVNPQQIVYMRDNGG